MRSIGCLFTGGPVNGQILGMGLDEAGIPAAGVIIGGCAYVRVYDGRWAYEASPGDR